MTEERQVERSVADVRRGAERLGSMGLEQRIQLLERLSRDTLAAAEDWTRAACAAKGLDVSSGTAAEEWLGGPVSVLRNLRLLRHTLGTLARTGRPGLQTREIVRRGGRTAVRVVPALPEDHLVLAGYRAEIRMLPEVEPENVEASMARAYQAPAEVGVGVCALLGAGNVSGIGLQDFLYKLIAENRACVLKTNPVNEYLAPHYERAFAAALEEDLLRVLPGDASVGAELVSHGDVDEVHMTGSGAVHDAIVWGTGEARERNRREGTPVFNKPITSELGCVTPVIITPGNWSPRALRHQAWNVATMVVHNASFNCNSAKVLVTSSAWPQRQEFLSALAAALSSVPPRLAYYPGADKRHAEFCAQHPAVTLCGEGKEDHLPWALATGIDPLSENVGAFEREPWCAVLAETALPEDDVTGFLAHAVEFCNERLFGTLSCALIIDPKTARSRAADYEAALAGLRYGSVVVNHWPAVSYALGVTPWGAYPGHTPEDIQSGVGFVHNTRLFSRVEKCVVEGPFAPRLKPLWFTGHRGALATARALAAFEGHPSPVRLLRVARLGLMG